MPYSLSNMMLKKFRLRNATDRKIKGLQDLIDKKTRQLASKATWDEDEEQQNILLTQNERLQKTIEVLRRNKPRLYNPVWAFALSLIVLAALTTYLVTARAPSTDVALTVTCNRVSFDWQDRDTELLTKEHRQPEINFLELLGSAEVSIIRKEKPFGGNSQMLNAVFMADSASISRSKSNSGPVPIDLKITEGANLDIKYISSPSGLDKPRATFNLKLPDTTTLGTFYVNSPFDEPFTLRVYYADSVRFVQNARSVSFDSIKSRKLYISASFYDTVPIFYPSQVKNITFPTLSYKREPPAIKEGKIIFTSTAITPYELALGEVLDLQGAEGTLRALSVDSTGLTVSFAGKVDDIWVGTVNNTRSIAPNLLKHLQSNEQTAFLVTAAVALLTLIFTGIQTIRG